MTGNSPLFHLSILSGLSILAKGIYDDLLAQNKLLFTLDLIKEKLANAYTERDEPRMAWKIIHIIDLCGENDCKPLLWFGRLLANHFEGIIAHASFPISSGKVEGINQRIKTLRRHGYGYPDDEYFFLKLFDMSRTGYTRNPKSHGIKDRAQIYIKRIPLNENKGLPHFIAQNGYKKITNLISVVKTPICNLNETLKC